MSTGINIAPSSDLTVGTTAVTSGTNGRVFFQAGGVVQQDGAFNWDNTNKRLGIGANATSPTSALFVRTNTIVANDIVTIQNGQYGNNIFRVRDNVTASQSTVGSIFVQARIYGSGSTITGNEFDLGGYGLGASYGDNGSNAVWLNNQGNVGNGDGTSVIAVSSNLYVNLQTTKKYKFEAVTGNFGIGNVGTLGARLDVRAQGALSTDIAFRVRNSADTASMFYTLGNGTSGTPWGDAYTLQYGDTNFGATISKNGQFGTHIRIFQFNGAASTVMSENGFATFGNLSVGGNAVSSYRILSSTGLGTEADHILLSQPQNGTRKASMLFNTNYNAGVSYNTARLQVETYVANTVDRTKFNFWAANGGTNIAPVIVGSLTCKSNILLGTPTEDINDSNTIYIPNGTAPTAILAGGGKLYVEGGALKYIGSAGTITTIGPA
jgi:hypothetical protein